MTKHKIVTPVHQYWGYCSLVLSQQQLVLTSLLEYPPWLPVNKNQVSLLVLLSTSMCVDCQNVISFRDKWHFDTDFFVINMIKSYSIYRNYICLMTIHIDMSGHLEVNDMSTQNPLSTRALNFAHHKGSQIDENPSINHQNWQPLFTQHATCIIRR